MIDPIQFAQEWSHYAVEQLRATTQPKNIKEIYGELAATVDTLPYADQAHVLKLAIVFLLRDLQVER
jgi:hypothetical protein